jgi:hypothetical protein
MSGTAIFWTGWNAERVGRRDRSFTDLACRAYIGVDSIIVITPIRPNIVSTPRAKRGRRLVEP